jgi:hypothetical protein
MLKYSSVPDVFNGSMRISKFTEGALFFESGSGQHFVQVGSKITRDFVAQVQFLGLTGNDHVDKVLISTSAAINYDTSTALTSTTGAMISIINVNIRSSVWFGFRTVVFSI